ncbi:Protein of unknown function [Ekhidna lutea]|uniref:DUF1573 domain-containing protein n=1 Tax=Ekhidna lutea TaxID=447679 RepID=A0A239L265_EKHLU|nr:DUF1573 domain-containing protein [Ekhidna lutea]SNT24400.1 Protein of unknown function [Ekhidna lutea]
MKYLATLLLIGFAFAATAQEEEPMTGPKISFTEKSFDFGEITQGEKVEHVFEFENIGTEPLVLSDVRTTCGCTAPEWPREPIAPGSKAKLKVVFNSAGKMGMQNKVITVMSNAVNNPERVKIVTNVMPPDNK